MYVCEFYYVLRESFIRSTFYCCVMVILLVLVICTKVGTSYALLASDVVWFLRPRSRVRDGIVGTSYLLFSC